MQRYLTRLKEASKGFKIAQPLTPPPKKKGYYILFYHFYNNVQAPQNTLQRATPTLYSLAGIASHHRTVFMRSSIKLQDE